MKFKKDGKVYESFEDAVDAFFLGDRKIFVNGEKAELKFPDDVRQSMIWAYEDADMGRVRLNAKLMGYEVIEDKPDTEKGVIMNNERKMSILLNTIEQMACDAEDKGEIDFGLRLTVEDAYALCHAASHTDNTPNIREVVEKYGEDVKRKLTRADILHAAESARRTTAHRRITLRRSQNFGKHTSGARAWMRRAVCISTRTTLP